MATTRIYTFGHGQHCPFTQKHLLDHYVTITAPTAAYCRQVMDKLFDGNWSADYLPGAPRLEAWLPQWTEHMRIVIPAVLQPDADLAGLYYSREADDPTPVSPARVPLHTGGMVDGDRLVDETDSKPMPRCLPGCRRTDRKYGKGSSSHADGCPEWAAAKVREADAPLTDGEYGTQTGTAECGCPLFPFGRGRDGAGDEIVRHVDGCTAQEALR